MIHGEKHDELFEASPKNKKSPLNLGGEGIAPVEISILMEGIFVKNNRRDWQIKIVI